MPVNQCEGVRFSGPCRSLFALGLMACPHCGSREFHVHGTQPGDEEYHWMPKITRSTGASDATTGPPAATADAAPVDSPLAEAGTVRAPSVNAVLGEVDGDPDRAREALAVELAGGSPRKTLVAQLEKLIADDDATSPDGDSTDSTGDETEGATPDAD